MAKLVSQVYGEALFDIARERDMIGQIGEELKDMLDVFAAYPQYRALFSNPRLDDEEKEEAFDRVFGGRICGELTGFFHLLLKNGRFGELEQIYGDFTERRLEYARIGVAYVQSAAALSADQKDRIEKKLLATTSYVSMQMHYAVDPSLIGGLKIRIGDRVVDSSIQSRLADMKSKLMEAQV